jgi:hypothetical protein
MVEKVALNTPKEIVPDLLLKFSILPEELLTSIVATLALGSQPKQRVARLRAKEKTQESHHMLP